jgi:AbrB family looped-hinge helix DNA binding protein
MGRGRSWSGTGCQCRSSKGQVVIPEEIRTRLGLEPGVQFVVVGDRDVVILKVLQAPDIAERVD